MPNLFNVAAWDVPKTVVRSSPDKKRESVNLDKLMKKLKPTKKRESKPISHPKPLMPKSKARPHARTKEKPEIQSPSTLPPGKRGKVDDSDSDSSSSRPPRKKVKFDKPAESSAKGLDSPSSLTTLQSGMKQGLQGARFRIINETLYKTDSHKAVQMIHDDPSIFHDYHAGFRLQAQSWPTHPVQEYIATLSRYSSRYGTIIADLGCGDAQLARALNPKGFTVLSFDLLSTDPFVIEADICSKVPLPGSEGVPGTKSDGEGQIIDVVVCALSLMATNWTKCVREAWRILKPNGVLKIAEVTSRLTDIPAFTALIESIGFSLSIQDEHNTHFTMFEFKKVARQWKDVKKWDAVLSKGSVLKPCEYKRR